MADIVHSSVGASNVSLSVTGVDLSQDLVLCLDERDIVSGSGGVLTSWKNQADTDALLYALPNVTAEDTWSYPPIVVGDCVKIHPTIRASYGVNHAKYCFIKALLPNISGVSTITVMALLRHETTYTTGTFPTNRAEESTGIAIKIAASGETYVTGFYPQPLGAVASRGWTLSLTDISSPNPLLDDLTALPLGWFTMAITTTIVGNTNITAKMYLNGELLCQKTGTQNGVWYPYMGNICFGNHTTSPNDLYNALALYQACYAWKRVLSDTEILQTHNALFDKYGLS